MNLYLIYNNQKNLKSLISLNVNYRVTITNHQSRVALSLVFENGAKVCRYIGI